MIPAFALASVPFSGLKMQVLVAGSVNPGPKQPPKPPPLRPVAMQARTHFILVANNLASVVAVPLWHFASSLFGSAMGGNCASAWPAIRHATATHSVTLTPARMRTPFLVGLDRRPFLARVSLPGWA